MVALRVCVAAPSLRMHSLLCFLHAVQYLMMVQFTIAMKSHRGTHIACYLWRTTALQRVW